MIDWVMFMKKTREIITAVLLISAAGACIFAADTVCASASAGIQRCLLTVIPSLFAMMAASTILVKSGAVTAAGRLLHRVGRLLFGMDGDVFVIFLFSNIAGYPVGAKMLMSGCETGRLTKNETAFFSGLCFGAGPAFIYGCIAYRLYGSERAGLLVIISAVSANLLLAAAMSVFLRRRSHGAPEASKVSFTADMLSDSISSAGRSMGEICFAIVGFAVISGLLIRFGAIPAAAELLSRATGRDFAEAAALICSALDVTAVSGLPAGDYTLLPAISALVSFGGFCVFMQLATIFRGRVPLLPIAAVRLVSAAVSYGISRLLLPYFLDGETAAAAAMTSQVHSEASPVPSVILIIMTVILFCKCRSSSQPASRARS